MRSDTNVVEFTLDVCHARCNYITLDSHHRYGKKHILYILQQNYVICGVLFSLPKRFALYRSVAGVYFPIHLCNLFLRCDWRIEEFRREDVSRMKYE